MRRWPRSACRTSSSASSATTRGKPARVSRAQPSGRVPTLEDDELVLTEAAAILNHLADRYPEGPALPPPAPPSARTVTAGPLRRTRCRPRWLALPLPRALRLQKASGRPPGPSSRPCSIALTHISQRVIGSRGRSAASPICSSPWSRAGAGISSRRPGSGRTCARTGFAATSSRRANDVRGGRSRAAGVCPALGRFVDRGPGRGRRRIRVRGATRPRCARRAWSARTRC